MTKLALTSDLHLEFYHDPHFQMRIIWDFKNTDWSDYIGVFAGDVHTGNQSVEIIEEYRKYFKDVIYIPGNHDHWHSEFGVLGDTQINAEQFDFDRNRKVFDVDDTRFICATAWAYHPRNEPFDNQINYYSCLIEHRKSTWDGEEQFSYQRWLEEGKKDYSFIFDQVAKCPADKKIVVITHYPPSQQSSHPRFNSMPGNELFWSSFEPDIIEAYDRGTPIHTWCHGHTHNAVDYDILGTRVVSHPTGYPGEIGYDVDYKPKIIEV